MGQYEYRSLALVVVKRAVALLPVSPCEVAVMLTTSNTLLAVPDGMFTTTSTGAPRPGPRVRLVTDRLAGQLLPLAVKLSVSVILPLFVTIRV